MEFEVLDYFSVGLLFTSIGFLVYYRHIAKQNFFFRRAPPLRVSDLHVFDDVWITGAIHAPRIAVPPFFNYETIQYIYTLHEKIIRYHRDSNGNEQKTESWELRHSESKAMPFFLNDGSGQVLIDLNSAIIKFPRSDYWQDSWWRHTLSYLPANGLASAVGVVSEKKDQLIRKGETPLMVTPMGRKQFTQSIRNEERLTKFIGLFALWFAFGVGIYSFNEHFSILRSGNGNLLIFLAGTAALIPFAGFYYHFTYNSLVQYRKKVINSWANIDIELKNRRELIPNLVQLVTPYLQHEHKLLLSISGIRDKLSKEKRLSERIKMENQVTIVLEKLSLQIEATQDLKSDSMLLLNKKLITIESKISHAKRHFNEVAEEYNNLVAGFPSNLVAKYNYFTLVPLYGVTNEKNIEHLGSDNKHSSGRSAEPPNLPVNIEQRNRAENEIRKKTA